jgi:hypothetical protein
MKIFVAETKYIRGVSTPEQHGKFLDEHDIEYAFKKRWKTDAHFISYQTGGPRYRKPYAELHRVTTQLLVFDLDNPNHKPWKTQEQVIEWFDQVVKQIPNFYCIYTTRAGGRLILKLSEPMDVRRAEVAHKMLCSEFVHLNIGIDTKCSDWTRLMRLPFVQREDGDKLWDNPFIDVAWGHEEFDLAVIPDIPKASFKGNTKVLTTPQPGPEARELIWEES